jgi:hypothetical protein
METIRRRAMEVMTSRRFPAPWRADKIPGGYDFTDETVEMPRSRSIDHLLQRVNSIGAPAPRKQ